MAAVILGSVAALNAHEAGTTRVVATFTPDRRYAIELTTDASTLLARLEVAGKMPRSSPMTIEDYRRGFAARCAEVGPHLGLLFDGSQVPVSPVCIVDGAVTGTDPSLTSLGVTVRVAGPIPAGARRFTWQYDLTYSTYALTVVSSAGRAEETQWLEGGEVSPVALLDRIAAPVARSRRAVTYLRLGFTHILPKGLDHILFVLGVVLLNRRLRPLLSQMVAFAAAHAAALVLTFCGVIVLPAALLDPLIALSIVGVAALNLVASERQLWRIVPVLGFGFLHGMRLAGTLTGAAIPATDLWLGLGALVVGVMAAQATLVLLASTLVGGWAVQQDGARRLAGLPAPALIAIAGLIWAVERLAS